MFIDIKFLFIAINSQYDDINVYLAQLSVGVNYQLRNLGIWMCSGVFQIDFHKGFTNQHFYW